MPHTISIGTDVIVLLAQGVDARELADDGIVEACAVVVEVQAVAGLKLLAVVFVSH